MFLRPQWLRAGWDRQRVLTEFLRRGVPGLSGSCSEIYREAAFFNAGLTPCRPLPVARELGETSIMFPVDPTITRKAMSEMGDIARQVLREATNPVPTIRPAWESPSPPVRPAPSEVPAIA
jgi:dTDP-4-amino-4,6-dideoxygalactose transaminase